MNKPTRPDPAAPSVAADPVRWTQRRWFADLCLIVTTLIWGINILVFKYAIGFIEPVIFNATRLVFSSLALAICVWAESRWAGTRIFPRSTPQARINWWGVAWFSLLTGIFYMVLFLVGISRTTAGNTALLLASMPMWTVILSFFLLHERLPRITWYGLIITIGGAVAVTVSGGQVDMGSEFLLGNLFILAAALSWAIATVISRPLLKTMSPLQLTFIASLTTTPFHMLWIASRLPRYWDQIIEPWMLTAIIFSGAFSTGLAYALWNTGVKILGGSHASSFQNIVTLVAVGGGWWLLGEQAFAGQVLGGVTIIVGVLVMRRGRQTPPRSGLHR